MGNLLISLGGMLFLAACTKHQDMSTVTQSTSSKSVAADVIYYYKGQAYPLWDHGQCKARRLKKLQEQNLE